MEVTKRYPLVNMYQGPGDMRCYSSLTRTSHSWFEWFNRPRQNKKPEIPSHICFPERAYSTVIPNRKVPEEKIVQYSPTKMSRFSAWKSNIEHLKFPLTFPALPDISENKSYWLLNTSLVKEVTQKLLSIFHLQHFCDLVSGLVNTVSEPNNTLMALKNTLEFPRVTESDNLNSSAVECGKLMSEFCESPGTFDHCSTTNQGDNKSVPVVSNIVLDVTRMTEIANIQKGNTPESLVPLLCENMTKIEVKNCSMKCQASDNESVAMMNDMCHSNSPVGEILQPGMKNKFKNVDEEMVTRKQRRINKHSKKRKRRMRKKEKKSAHSLEKGRTSTKKKVLPSTSSQIKCRSGLPGCPGSTALFHDWEDSDDDFCIVFDDEVDSACDMVPESMNDQSNRVAESADLWIEFDSLTIVSGSNSASVDCRSYSSGISIQYDSDSEVEYETDSGQVFVDTDDFDSLSGLVFLSDNGDGCSVLPGLSYVNCPSFTSSTTSHELVSDYAGLYEVNKRWREISSHVDGKPRLPHRVTFAPEEELVAVFPVDTIDRKGEWEQFALERFRFKRRIDEFEKIIAPYLTCAHREKTFRRLADTAS